VGGFVPGVRWVGLSQRLLWVRWVGLEGQVNLCHVKFPGSLGRYYECYFLS